MKSFQYLCCCFFICLASSVFSQTNENIITEASDPVEEFYLDDIVERKMIYDNRVLPYEPIREADIAWQKRIWRVLDTREKINLSFRNPEKPFFDVLKENIENGYIKAFNDEKFREELSAEDISKRLNRIDTLTFYDEDTYEEQIRIVENPINPEDIMRYRIKEIWFFDEESSTMKVRIMGIAPVQDVFDPETGVFKYELPLFWVYYPASREYLAKHRVVNDFNDMSPMTWYDLFESRFFSSYIYKQSNTLDLRLVDIYPESGIDLLLESEKIKQELFNFEHDLWEY